MSCLVSKLFECIWRIFCYQEANRFWLRWGISLCLYWFWIGQYVVKVLKSKVGSRLHPLAFAVKFLSWVTIMNSWNHLCKFKKKQQLKPSTPPRMYSWMFCQLGVCSVEFWLWIFSVLEASVFMQSKSVWFLGCQILPFLLVHNST